MLAGLCDRRVVLRVFWIFCDDFETVGHAVSRPELMVFDQFVISIELNMGANLWASWCFVFYDRNPLGLVACV